MKPIWWLPTFGFGLFLAIELSMFAIPGQIFEDPGVGRHLRTAEVILETGQVPRADPLSFTKAGEPWTDYEWAFEATVGELYRAGGLGLVAAFCFAIFASTVLGVYRTVLQSGVSLSTLILCTGMAWLTLHLHFAVRPVLFTYLFMALVVEVWYRQAQPRGRDWLFLPIVFVAWGNLHAGWLAAFVFWGFSIFGRILDRIAGRVDGDEAPVIPWIGLALLCLLATWFNPLGWTLHHQVIAFASTYKSFALWDEFQPPNFAGPSMSAVTILFVLGVTLLAKVRRNPPTWRWEALLPMLFFLYSGLKTQRHVLLLIEVSIIPVARDLEVLLHGHWWPALKKRLSAVAHRDLAATNDTGQAEAATLTVELGDSIQQRLKDFQARQRAAGGDAWLSLVAALVLTALFVRTPAAHHIEVGKSVTPKLIAFVRDHPDRFQRPLTTTWNAGPLLWNLRPDFRVSFDDRGDFYGDDTVFSFVNLYNGAAGHGKIPGWREMLEKGNYDSAILDSYLQLNQFLHFMPEWHEVYRDEHTVVYWRQRK
ncbi:MAG: hypothetical protein LV479_11050 [Methylacidiphilales bacterium]|nr:hypothetical protein [Candidatus Methylacidiphilales bacterium]